jgi:hypothetical protein
MTRTRLTSIGELRDLLAPVLSLALLSLTAPRAHAQELPPPPPAVESAQAGEFGASATTAPTTTAPTTTAPTTTAPATTAPTTTAPTTAAPHHARPNRQLAPEGAAVQGTTNIAALKSPVPVPVLPVFSVPEWMKTLSIGGGAILWYFQPLQSGAKNGVDLFFVNLVLDEQIGDFGLHVEPRFRDSKLRPHFGGAAGGTAWVQEVYARAKLPGATLKVGKAYSHFALFWDNSFYGNVQVYDGLKLDPDFGLSLEGAVAEGAPAGVRYWLQYFIVDGQTNVALEGRETFTIPGARRRNQAIVRVEPFFSLALPGSQPIAALTVKVGLSGEYLQADLPGPVGKQDVYRGAADITVSVGRLSLWSEFIRQQGQTVTDFPIAGFPATAPAPATPGQASRHTNYFLVGGELNLGKVVARYNVSYGGYRDLSISEWMHVPAVGVAVSPNVTLLGEFVYWKRYVPAPQTDAIVDKSLNVTLQAHF